MTESTGIISQMVVKKGNQRSEIEQKILQELILKCKTIKVKKIELSAREIALKFYSKIRFKAFEGNKYSSTKTGIILQKTSININNLPN